ncbi:MAG: selenide, water dikinase SelD [Planctomycetes bacterium]|nr:selenide, water dikinase SelD [Planctomycetota bacterium]
MAKIDLEKRRRVMQRSRKLGHCICEPRRPCPCDVFTRQGICPCAGERPEPLDLSQVRLTTMVRNAGCASKIAPGDLEAVLSRLPAVADPNVISGIPAADDAAIYRLNGDICLVQTVDVMTPCADDPEIFGRICAANCLSDIYAMGGRPLTALSILAFPSETLDGRIMYLMMKGAMDVLAKAGCSLVGGHSIKDQEIKLGFAVTGLIREERAARHDTAKAGDVLVLTKPLGTGTLGFAAQVGRGADMSEATASMMELNGPAAEAMDQVGASACTDVTGFGLFGHLVSMLRHSGVSAEIWAARLPAFDGVLELLADGVAAGAIERNREFVGKGLHVAAGVDGSRVELGLDAQTSGGLLISVQADRHSRLITELENRGVRAWTIGKILSGRAGEIKIVRDGGGKSIVNQRAAEKNLSVCLKSEKNMGKKTKEKGQGHSPDCCADTFKKADCCPTGQAAPAGQSGSSLPATKRAFGEFLKAAAGPGAIDEKTKELIAFALVVYSRCKPCLAAHRKKALDMGLTPQQLDEAAWLAVFMGGAPAYMFYQDAIRE